MTVDDGKDEFRRLSNWGRWGPDDEIGTLNLIDAAAVLRGVASVRDGTVVSLARTILPNRPMKAPAAVQQRMLFHSADSQGALDAVEIAPHGLEVTHIDALSHAFHDGRAYPGRPSAEALSHDGLRFGDVAALAGGAVTRGILADIPRARGIERLEPGERVTGVGIEHALKGRVRPRSGDALVLRTGIELQGEEDRTSSSRRTGLDMTAVRWMREHDIAIYAGDCVEAAPLKDPDENPLHGVGLVSMGLVMIDAPTVERLADACHDAGRWEFLFVCAALPIEGATGCAVNPVAVL